MAEWESSYGGMFLHNARLLTNEEIKERYPLEIIVGCFTDMSERKAIYAAVRLRNLSDIPVIY